MNMKLTSTLTFESERDCVMCSEMVPLEDDGWAVCNQSVYHQRCLQEANKIRIFCDVTLAVRQEFVNPDKGTERLNVKSTLVYMAKIDLQGWVPTSLVERVACKEWPRALQSVCDTARQMVEKRGTENEEFFVDCAS